MNKRALRVGLVGAGWVTGHHLHAWKALGDNVSVVAIADPALDRAADRAREFGISATFASLDAMLAACALDVVDIAAPRATHADLVRLAARHGVDVLCQKPLAANLAQAEQLVRDVGESVRVMVHENWRFRAYYRRAKELLDAGRIGKVKAVSLRLLTSGTVPDANGRVGALERQPFLREESRMLIAEVLIHHLDTLRFLLGPLQVRAAVLSRTNPDIAGEDGAVLHLTTAEGAGVGVFASFAAHGAPVHQKDQLLILGECGSLELDGSCLTLAGTAHEQQGYDAAQVYADSYRDAIAHFVTCLANGQAFETSAHSNLATLQLVEDCYRLGGDIT